MSLNLALALTYDGVLLLVCALAWVRGGRPERIGALISLGASLATIVLRWLAIASGAPAEAVVLAIDGIVAGSFFYLATHSTRFWPIWAFGFALSDIIMSLAGALLPRTPLFAYHTGLGIYAYLALGALALGAMRLPRDASPDERRGFRSSWRAETKI